VASVMITGCTWFYNSETLSGLYPATFL